MKIFLQFLFVAFLSSCNGSSQQIKQQAAINENLQISSKKTLRHIYTKSEVLDTSYVTDSIYLKGEFAEVINLIIIRDYDPKNNLLFEKTFEISKPNELIEERLFSYDMDNNLISETLKFAGVTRSIIKKYYNDHNQEIKRIEIMNNQSSYPEGNNRRLSIPRYDTIIFVNAYDSQGHLIKQTTSNSNNVVEFTLHTIYSNGQKNFGYELDANSDTLTTFNFKKVGNLIEETVIHKPDPNSYIINWYDSKKMMKSIFYDSRENKKFILICKYDEKGNEVENISYK